MTNNHVVSYPFARQHNDRCLDAVVAEFAYASVSYTNQGRQKMVKEPAMQGNEKTKKINLTSPYNLMLMITTYSIYQYNLTLIYHVLPKQLILKR